MYLNLFVLTFAVINSYSQLGLGTNTPNPAAVLDLTSTTKGLLPPRMTGSQRNAISAPVAGLTIWCSDCGTYGETQVYNGLSWTNMIGAAVSDQTITSPTTGRVWMDRNLGATQRALSSTDNLAKGSLFQWGRKADGHELINWTGTTPTVVHTTTTTTKSSTYNDNTIANVFIITSGDWLIPENTITLWQGVNGGYNNPCPAGFNVPSKTEFENELASTDKLEECFTKLKLTTSASRFGNSGVISYYNSNLGFYYSSTVDINGKPHYIKFGSGNTDFFSANATTTRGDALSVRCIKSN